jgi:hypothetical protein
MTANSLNVCDDAPELVALKGDIENLVQKLSVAKAAYREAKETIDEAMIAKLQRSGDPESLMRLALREAIKKAGGHEVVARHFNLTRQAVWMWRKVPPLRVLELERLSGVSRHRLRPDVYPKE